MHPGHRLRHLVSTRPSMSAAEHTCQGQQFVCDEDGRVVLAAIEGFLAPLAKISLHNFASALDRVCLGGLLCFAETVSPVEAAVGGGAGVVARVAPARRESTCLRGPCSSRPP